MDRVEVERVALRQQLDPLRYRSYLPLVMRGEGGVGGMSMGLAPKRQAKSGGTAVIEAEGGGMLYGRGDFQAGHVVPGQEELTESGALRFVVGARAYAAEYDANGNMASRVTEAGAQVLAWDAENRLVGYQSSVASASYLYDGDGVRVKTVITDTGGTTTTVHIGGYFEWVNGSTARKYYYHNGLRVAMREGGELYFLLGDYLGSTSVSYRVSDGQTITQRYYAWGDIRPGPDNALPTDYTFTGQRLDDGSQLVQMGARWYDSRTGRWLSADTIVPEPGNPQNLNRYTYVNNNPLHYTDPTGHYTLLEEATCPFPAFAVRRTPTGWHILGGGSHFRNEQERAWANHFLAGTPQPPLPGGVFGSTIIATVANAYREVSGERVPETTIVMQDPLFAMGAATVAGKAVALGLTDVFALAGIGMPADQAQGGGAPPNPYGRLGGPEHQAGVKAAAAEILQRRDDVDVRYEFRFGTPGGQKSWRYVDVAAVLRGTDVPVEFHQIGALRVDGAPVAREARAISDIVDWGEYPGVPVYYHSK